MNGSLNHPCFWDCLGWSEWPFHGRIYSRQYVSLSTLKRVQRKNKENIALPNSFGLPLNVLKGSCLSWKVWSGMIVPGFFWCRDPVDVWGVQKKTIAALQGVFGFKKPHPKSFRIGLMKPHWMQLCSSLWNQVNFGFSLSWELEVMLTSLGQELETTNNTSVKWQESSCVVA